MKFAEIASRLNGVSCPIFGVSWQPGTADVTVARDVLAHVETKRVLFSTYTNEVPDHCLQSVLELRAYLTSVIGTGGIGPELSGPIRLMRRYCVRFLDRIGPVDASVGSHRLFSRRELRMNDYWFGEALGELRAGVGLQVAVIAASFGLDVEDELAAMLPAAD